MLTIPYISYLAVFVSAIAAYALGALWHGPLYGKVYMKLVQFTPIVSKKKMAVMKRDMTIGFFSTLLLAFMTACFVSWLGATNFFEGVLVGVLLWLGFELTMLLGGFLWEAKSFELFRFNAIYRLVEIVVIAGIIGAW